MSQILEKDLLTTIMARIFRRIDNKMMGLHTWHLFSIRAPCGPECVIRVIIIRLGISGSVGCPTGSHVDRETLFLLKHLNLYRLGIFAPY